MFLAPNEAKILGSELNLIHLFFIWSRDMKNDVNEALVPIDV